MTRWRDLLEQLQPFAANCYSNFMKPVMLPPGRARLATKPAPTGSATREHDRDCRVSPAARGDDRSAVGSDDVGLQLQPVPPRALRNRSASPRRPAIFDPQVAAFDPAQFLQPSAERCRRTVPSDRLGRRPSARQCAASLGCCARAASGHAAAPPRSVMNSRRLIAAPEAQDRHRTGLN